MTLDLRAWRGHAGFAAQEAVWEECRAAAALDPLCNGHRWTLAHARAFAPDGDVFGWTAFDGTGRAAGVLALKREPARGTLALRRALFLADGSFDSDYLAPPVVPGRERELARALIDAARGEPGLEALVLGCLPEDSRFLGELRAELGQRGLARREHAVPCLATALPDSLERYLATLKSRMRTKVRSALRGAGGAVLRWTTREDELAHDMDELYRLHELRWRAAGKEGSFADPRRRAFYLELARASLPAHALRLALLEREGRVLAAQFGLLAGGRYYQIQEGYDPALEEERPGIALRARAVEALIAEGVRAYDFMAGDSRHKRDWGGELRACTTLAFPLPRWRARLAYAARSFLDRRRAAAEPAGENASD